MHLAQLNIGRLLAPIDHPDTAEFKNALDAINALAEASDGFVWRLVGENNNATALRIFPDPDMLINMSTWTSREALRAYVYQSAHTPFLRRRAQWFERIAVPVVVFWWVSDGYQPTLAEARARHEHLCTFGPTPYAFGWRDEFAPLVVRRTELDDPVAVELIAELNADLLRRQPTGDHFFSVSPQDVAAGSGGFFVSWFGDVPVGCGGFRTTEYANGHAAELKRMWVRPAAQGNGFGHAMVSHLMGEARALGLDKVVLETGPEQPEAIAVYTRAGLRPIPPFGQYVSSNSSLCFGRTITP